MLRIITLIVALLSVSSAFAQCPPLEIRGLEQKTGQPRAWTAVIDLNNDLYSASLGAQKRTADINAVCMGPNMQIMQMNSSDGDDCTYELRSAGLIRPGTTVIGKVTCASGPAELRSARLFTPSGPVVINDQRIMSIIQTADNMAQRFSAIVVGLAASQEVREFAQTMQDDHKDLNGQLDQLVQAANINLKPSPISVLLERLGAQKRADLVQVVGPRVDRLYVESEIGFHARMLATFDEVLMKNAKSPDVKQFVQDAREVFARHAHHALETAPLLGIPTNTGGRVFFFCQPGSRDPC